MTRPMTLSEKTLCHNCISLSKPEVSPGETIVIRVARTLASELTLVGIKTCLEMIGNPNLWRNDRFFLACDHSVDPRNYDNEIIKRRIDMCQEFSDKYQLTDYFGPNQSILHTEFYRQKAVPGTIIVGADSHSCAHGCVGSYAMGMGAADVTMPMVTGTTWLTVPETLLIEFTGILQKGFVGKDVILWILKKFGRNTVALDKCVEFGGCFDQFDIDSRFAISNMATELGGIAGIFPADERTNGFLERRQRNQDASLLSVVSTSSSDTLDPPAHNDNQDEVPVFFRADKDAEYSEKCIMDLNEITEYVVARWPSPDHVYCIHDERLYEALFDGDNKKVCATIRYLDGCFIGACTTTESEIILAGLLLEVMMNQFGYQPAEREIKPYKRQVTPGSKLMLENLDKMGILDIYKRAGFHVGAPGCSYCLGVGYDKALEGEIWLSSQNRNFKHRMGKGAIGNITSATVVAASSFNMTITCPKKFINQIDWDRYEKLIDIRKKDIKISEPQPLLLVKKDAPTTNLMMQSKTEGANLLPTTLKGKIQRFGDSVDTDAIIPAQYIPLRGHEQGLKSFAVVKPQFIDLIKKDYTIIVAGEGFGCGSSREEAASCLNFVGVKAVIAKSFSFIFGRNLLSMNLFGITIKDEAFYELAKEGHQLEIDIINRTVRIEDERQKGYYHKFTFPFSQIQEAIYNNGGIIRMYCSQGRELYNYLSEINQKPKLCCTEFKW